MFMLSLINQQNSNIKLKLNETNFDLNPYQRLLISTEDPVVTVKIKNVEERIPSDTVVEISKEGFVIDGETTIPFKSGTKVLFLCLIGFFLSALIFLFFRGFVSRRF